MLRAYKIQTQPINTAAPSDSVHTQATRSDGRRLATGQTLSCLPGPTKDLPHKRQILAPSWVRLVLGLRTQGAKPDTVSAMNTLSLWFWNVLSRGAVDSMLED